MDITQSAQVVIDGINENQGLVTVVIFVMTILLGWISGVFRVLRRKPELKLKLYQAQHLCVLSTLEVSMRAMSCIAQVLPCI